MKQARLKQPLALGIVSIAFCFIVLLGGYWTQSASNSIVHQKSSILNGLSRSQASALERRLASAFTSAKIMSYEVELHNGDSPWFDSYADRLIESIGGIENIQLAPTQVRTSWLYELAHKINRMPSLYLESGAIHGSVLCQADQPLVYMEDVGRHNAVDKIAGWMYSESASSADKILYTTGRLTSEMVIKTAQMGIPVLVSRSGFTAWGVDLARQVGLTLIGRMRGKRFICLSGEDRLDWDIDPDQIHEEPKKSGRKGSSK